MTHTTELHQQALRLARTLGRRFTVRPNASDVRVECGFCRASRTGSHAWAWGHEHVCPEGGDA